MKIFLCGGGSGKQTASAYKKFIEISDRSKPMLYIPFAMPAETYQSCYEWISGEFRTSGFNIVTAVSADELSKADLYEYGALFIGGGNTFKLLSELKEGSCFGAVRDYIENDGVTFGSSAGAIIFGSNIDSCGCEDDNEIGLKDTAGFDILNGVSLFCHYTNRSEDITEAHTRFLNELSAGRKIIALPEEDTIFINGSAVELIGTKPYYEFENGRVTKKLYPMPDIMS